MSRVLIAFLILNGCGGTSRGNGEETVPVVSSEHEPEAGSGASTDGQNASTEGPVSEPEVAEESSTILRRDIQAVLDAGPASLLARVRTEPARQGRRFLGFRIAAFTGGPPRTIDLQIGDIILEVNGRFIERPEDLYAVFNELRVASELKFVVLRDGERTTLAYPIVD